MVQRRANSSLTAGGVKFDFVGFDACLMATTENALMLTKHVDYMIASEETAWHRLVLYKLAYKAF